MTPPELTSARLRLLPLAVDDAELLLPVYADPEVTQYFQHRFTDLEGVRAAVKQRLAREVPPGMGTWLIQYEGTIIGHAHLWPARRPAGLVEIGWLIGKAYWGKGLATEAARTVVEHGIRRLGLPAIFALVHRDNAASLRVADKLGFLDVGEEIHHDAPHRVTVLLAAQAGGLHHVELRVSDLAAAQESLGWLLGELGWLSEPRWTGGLGWRNGPHAIVVNTAQDPVGVLFDGDISDVTETDGFDPEQIEPAEEPASDEADVDKAEPERVSRAALAVSAGSAARVAELTTAAVDRGWQLLSIDRYTNGDDAGRQVVYLRTADGIDVELVGEAAADDKVFDGFGPGTA